MYGKQFPEISDNQEGFVAGKTEYAPGEVAELKRMDAQEALRRPKPGSSGCPTCTGKKKFPKDVCDKMKQLMDDSYPGGHSQEHGGTLVSDSDGNMALANAGAGQRPNAGSFSPDLSAPAGDKVLGIFHTHPYDASEGNYTDVSLSGGDAAYMVNNHHDIMVARSGDGLFIYEPTSATPGHVDFEQTNNDQNARIGQLVNGGMGFPEASRQAAAETADRLHLKYYEGKGCSADEVKK